MAVYLKKLKTFLKKTNLLKYRRGSYVTHIKQRVKVILSVRYLFFGE